MRPELYIQLSCYLNSIMSGDLVLAPRAELYLFLAFFLAFAVKVPLFPFHTWLPDAHVEAPTAGSVLLAGVLLKMGTYGLIRFSLPLFPDISHLFAPLISLLAIVGIIYGALVAMVQPDMKKLVAYSSVSHMGFIVLGIFSFTIQGMEGAYLPDARPMAYRPEVSSCWLESSMSGGILARSRNLADSRIECRCSRHFSLS